MRAPTSSSTASACSSGPTTCPAALSGGEQQRVAVCAAVAHRPRPAARRRARGRARRRERRRSSTGCSASSSAAPGRPRSSSATTPRRPRSPTGSSTSATGASSSRRARAERPRSSSRARGWARLPHGPRGGGGAPLRARRRSRKAGIVLTPVAARAPSGRPRTPRPPRPAAAPAPAPGSVRGELAEVGKRYPAAGGERARARRGHAAASAAGALTAIVGRSGSGKTTLLHLLAGLERPSERRDHGRRASASAR